MSDLILKQLQKSCVECPKAFGIIIGLYPDMLNYVDKYGNTWLIIASRTNPESLLEILKSPHCSEAHLQKTNYDGDTVMLTACKYQPQSVKYLLESDKCTLDTISQTNVFGETYLMIASKYQKLALEYLIKSDKCTTELMEQQNKFNMETVLFYNCENSPESVEAFQTIMDSPKASVKLLQTVNACGQSVLYHASRNKSFRTVKYILAHLKCSSEFVSVHKFSNIHRNIFGNEICDLICNSDKYYDENKNIEIDENVHELSNDPIVKNDNTTNIQKQISFTMLEMNIQKAKLEIEKLRLELKLKNLPIK